MTDPVMSYASIMRAQIDRLDAIAQNASNTNSVGYLQQSMHTDNQDFMALINDEKSRAGAQVYHSHQLGGLSVTNRNTDVAMVSDAWFVLEGVDNLITRNGRFSVSTDGYLMLGNHKVMGEAGAISNVDSSISIRADGGIYLGDKYVDKLKLVSISKEQPLTSLGNGVYLVNGNLIQAEQAKVVQGGLTSSNVILESDMTQMIEITRHVEMLQRAMSAYDDMLDVGINQIGK